MVKARNKSGSFVNVLRIMLDVVKIAKVLTKIIYPGQMTVVYLLLQLLL